MKKYLIFLFLSIAISYPSLSQQISIDSINAIIRREAFQHSRVMDLAWSITDRNGPRLTGSPGLDKATEWAQVQMEYWNLDNIHTEEWGPFGRGWTLKEFTLEALGDSYFPVLGYPKAWSGPVVKGPVTGDVIYLNAATEEELQEYKGRLKGRFVLLDTLRTVEEWKEPLSRRLGPEDLLELANAPMPNNSGGRRWRGYGDDSFSQKLWDFIYAEQPVAVIERHFKGDYGTVFTQGAKVRAGQNAWDKGLKVIPQVVVAVEQYNRIFRLLEKRKPVKLRLRLDVAYNDDDPMERNIIGEIPGSDLRDEVVMLGGHFDSWHTGTGATDNGAGSAVTMEAMRILQEVFRITGTRPRRTIRLALWTGEEQGLLGSRGYCEKHFAVRDTSGEIVSFLPEHEKISAYYNFDNGTGRIRGIYQQGNMEVGPIFREWLSDWKDLGATTLSLRNTGGTDIIPFDRLGIPAFQFIQDPVEYGARTHHSNMDTWDHLVADDLKQAAAIIASLVYQTAMRDEMMPRKKIDQ